MCGICGVVSDGAPPDPSIVTSMMAQLCHRGPDGSGYVRDHQAVLGQTRLAIIDTVGGVQPLANEDDTIWVSFNGEIFNYVELGAQLREAGHRFRTASDTEVIVHAWEQWGEDCFNRFNGQWAIALWDRKLRRLVLSRDRLGVRPLFYHRTQHSLTFASEIKAIFVDPRISRQFDPIGLGQVFSFWSAIAPTTVFSGIEQLPPGHLAVYEAGSLTVRPYWTIDFPPRGQEPSQDLHENIEGLRERLIAATKLRFERSDVPVGAYLSGGLDSSVTTAIIRNYTDAPLDTFSLRFEDASFDEGAYQSLMAEQLGTNHHEVVVSRREIAGVFPEVIWHTETPILRSAPAPMYLLSRLVRNFGYRVVVTGEGADEVMGGYDIFREARVRSFWARNPHSSLRDHAVELLYPWMQRNPSQTPAFARSFFGMDLDPADPAMSHRPRWNTTGTLRSMLTEHVRARLGDEAPAALQLPVSSASWDPLARAQWLEMTTLLPGYILASQGDRMLMANSVEGRFPFLDVNVVTFANQLPARHKLFGVDEKHLLKLAFADLVPEAVRHRPKQPYRAPDAASFYAGGGPDWLAEVLSPAEVRAAGVFDPVQVSGLARKAATRSDRFGNTDNMRMLAVVSTQLVHRQFIADDPAVHARSTAPEPVHVFDLVNNESEQQR